MDENLNDDILRGKESQRQRPVKECQTFVAMAGFAQTVLLIEFYYRPKMQVMLEVDSGQDT